MMAHSGDWKIPASAQPKPGDYEFDLDEALSAIVGLRALVPSDAFTAETLGTERAGHGAVIRGDGLILTIGYLITEAEQVWLSLSDGRVVSGHVLGYDQETGFGLVQALARLDVPALPLGRSAAVELGERVIMAGAGGRRAAVAAHVVSREEFAGYWEYLIQDAFLTAPAHPNWGGTAMIGEDGALLGIGSLQLQQARGGSVAENLNMVVPIDLVKPIFDDLVSYGRPNRPARPWLGIYATEMEGRIVLLGLAQGGPADQAGLQTGDIILAVAGRGIGSLPDLFRAIWRLGHAGVPVPLRIHRDGRVVEIEIRSTDRSRLLKAPRLH
jgi:S1-C subfamily serine protease